MRELTMNEVEQVVGGITVSVGCGKSTTTTITKNPNGSTTTTTVEQYGCGATVEKK